MPEVTDAPRPRPAPPGRPETNGRPDGWNSKLLERYPQVRLIRSVEEALALRDAARDDGYTPLLPTHLIERGREIIGCVAVNSLPLFRVWLHREKVRARESAAILNVIENGYRAQGHGLVASLLAPDSAFAPVHERFGYHAWGLALVLVKKL